MVGTTPTVPILNHKHSERSDMPSFVDVPIRR